MTLKLKATAGMVFVGCIVACLATLSYRHLSAFLASSNWVIGTHEALEQVESARVALYIAERDADRYLITKNRSFLDSSRASVASLRAHLDELGKLTRDNPRQQQRLTLLRPVVQRRIALLEQAANQPRDERLESARRMLGSGGGREASNQAQLILGGMQKEESDLLLQRHADFNAYARQTTRTFFLVLAIAVVLLGAFYLLALQDAARLGELNNLFELSLDLLCVATTDGYFKRLSQSWETTLGIPRKELLSKPWLESIHPDDRGATIAIGQRLFAGEDVVSFENRYRCADGSYRWLCWNSALRGHLIFASARDVTEQKRTAEEILAVNARLDAANRELELRNREIERATQLKSQFLASMSHEVRTPLNAIVGFSDLLAEERIGPLNEKQKRFVGHIIAGARHLLQLINDILDLSKIEAGRLTITLETFRISEALPEVLSNIRQLAMARKLSVQEKIGNEAVFADRIRFKQILYNLLSNAVKFTPEGGRIVIESRNDDAVVTVSVKDSGVGIRPEDQEIIFEEFRQVGDTTRGVKEGTGLGLAITKRLIETQGGNIWVESKPGNGSCFTFTLPAGKQAINTTPRVEIAGCSDSKEEGRRERPLVLVIDDDVKARELIASYLDGEGYAVEVASTAEEGWRAACDRHPDLVTLDILMPEKSGWDVLHRLKNTPATTHIPIVIMSILDDDKLGFALGAVEYLVKPVRKEELLRAIRAHIGDGSRQGKILVVEDDPHTRELVRSNLEAAGYAATVAMHGKDAMTVLMREEIVAIVLDLVMPEMDGFEVLQWMVEHEALRDIPVFVITAKDLSTAELALLKQRAMALVPKHSSWGTELLQQVRKAVGAPASAPVAAKE